MESHCPKCGAELSADISWGVCPKCLLENELAGTQTVSIPETENPDLPAHYNLERLGDYELISEIARGGMGVVYKARQVSLNRIVALKMILKGQFASSQEVRRFQSEAEAAGALDHPNILPVYDVGQEENWHYFSMKMIDGENLDRKMGGHPIESRDAAKLLETVARAVHHAHQHGILHRDLKPANILLDQSGAPYVTDFGLAKHIKKEGGATDSGTIIGTPGYMSPEQASGNAKRVTTAADIYSLGAILYQMLTGRPPFEGEATLELLRRVLDQEPERPRNINPQIDRDLESICMKCLEKDPRHRYASAEALANDLHRFQNGEPIAAAASNMLHRLDRLIDRSQHDAEFQNWGTMLLLFGGVIMIGHLSTFFLVTHGRSEESIWMLRGGQIVALFLVFWLYRPRTLLPTTAVERQLWSIWIGVMLAYTVNVLAGRLLAAEEANIRARLGEARWNELMIYPTSAILGGLAFFSMGSNYWGRCYQFGLGFFALAVVMPLKLEWAPIVFGLFWGIILTAFGVHLRRMRKTHASTIDITPSDHAS